jgi:hypothetical protein
VEKAYAQYGIPRPNFGLDLLFDACPPFAQVRHLESDLLC